MKITKDQLKCWKACQDGYGWFLRRFPDGEAEYQDVLNALAEDDRPADAAWLMNHAGPDRESVLEVEVIADCKHFFASGRLVIKTSATVAGQLTAGDGIEAGEGINAGEGIKAGTYIEAGTCINAGDGIKAGWGIKAGEGIKAGLGIEAGEGIEAGGGFGVFAGLRLQLADWPINARVIANVKPDNLVSGSWANQ